MSEQGLFSVAWRPTFPNRLLYVFYTGDEGRAPAHRRAAGKHDNARRGPAQPAYDSHAPPPPTTPAASFSSAMTASFTRRPAMVARPPTRPVADDLLGKLLRIDPPERGAPYTVPAGNPFVGGRVRRDLGLRPAQPVPVLLRQHERRPAAVRRRPEHLRGGQLCPDVGGARPRRQLRLGLPRGSSSLLQRWPLRRLLRLHGPIPRVQPCGRRLLDHRRLCRPRPDARQYGRALPLRRPLPGRDPLHHSRFSRDGRPLRGGQRPAAGLLREDACAAYMWPRRLRRCFRLTGSGARLPFLTVSKPGPCVVKGPLNARPRTDVFPRRGGWPEASPRKRDSFGRWRRGCRHARLLGADERRPHLSPASGPLKTHVS